MSQSNGHSPRLATFVDDGWMLEDGETRHQAHPATFWIPDFSVRDHLEVGDWAKLLFLPAIETQHTGERMWVEVEIRQGGFYRGRLLNTPVVIEQLGHGSVLWFEPRHVIDIVLKADQETDD